MYPQTYLSLFPPFPRSPKAFVAMSFAPQFNPRWEQVLHPALARIRLNDVPLKPFRVDMSKVGDAILTEILQAISDSAVIVADISTIGTLGSRSVRNANVLYEIGIAHASRRPEEVILFRSDDDPLDFDVQGVRVHTYRPHDDLNLAQDLVAETVLASLRTVETTRRSTLRFAAQRLTLGACSLLLESNQGMGLEHPPTRTMGQVLGGLGRIGAIELLLELGAMQAKPMKVTSELLDRAERDPNAHEPWLKYELTAFGKALATHLLNEMVPSDPSIIERMGRIFGKANFHQE